MSLLIKNGHIITATDDYRGDIYIEDEKIVATGEQLRLKADRTIDAAGLFVFPGGIDPHVHLDMPFMGTFSSDTHETGHPARPCSAALRPLSTSSCSPRAIH